MAKTHKKKEKKGGEKKAPVPQITAPHPPSPPKKLHSSLTVSSRTSSSLFLFTADLSVCAQVNPSAQIGFLRRFRAVCSTCLPSPGADGRGRAGCPNLCGGVKSIPQRRVRSIRAHRERRLTDWRTDGLTDSRYGVLQHTPHWNNLEAHKTTVCAGSAGCTNNCAPGLWWWAVGSILLIGFVGSKVCKILGFLFSWFPGSLVCLKSPLSSGCICIISLLPWSQDSFTCTFAVLFTSL